MTDEQVTTASALAPTAPLPSPEVPRYEGASPEKRAEIEQALTELHMDDSNAVLFFGTSAQEAVTAVADEMLEGVRNKDTGEAGQALNQLVTTLRGMPIAELDPKKKPGLLRRLSGRARPVARMLQQYEQVRRQVDGISNRLDRHTSALMRDVVMLDRLFEKTLEYFRRLEVYIAAGQEQLRRLDSEVLPALTREAAATQDMVKAQQAADLRARRDDLERRVHDLKLTRQVVMQSLPSIRLVQQNDKALVGKIASTMANTLPLWRQQLALSLTIARSAEAAETVQKATDLTNELLTANAETLRSSTQAIRTQVERGIVDMAALKQANDALIATVDDALRIADDGKRQRAEAERQLEACEVELRQAVLAARRRGGVEPGRP
ncbi:MAG TPA: toxic anion resistance protein [Vicinamibacterales bacterium]|mgnify:FL=1|nr:toxic anion resistance protein [Acidobacteriota bacterium]HOC19164.1 toxic anion resistance protein [Vicinamibacterales bacterium]